MAATASRPLVSSSFAERPKGSLTSSPRQRRRREGPVAERQVGQATGGRPEPDEVRAAAVAAVAAFLAVGDRTLRVESFFMRAPEEQQERLYRDLLLRQATSYVLRFTLDEAGDLFLVGQVPLRAITAEEVDRIVGTVLDVADAAYLPAVEIGFASSIAAEKAWRARLAEGSARSPKIPSK